MARWGKWEELTWGWSSLLGFWEKARICLSAIGFSSPLLFSFLFFEFSSPAIFLVFSLRFFSLPFSLFFHLFFFYPVCSPVLFSSFSMSFIPFSILGFFSFVMATCFWPKSALNFNIYLIKSLISLIKLIQSSIKFPNLLILQLNSWYH